MPLTWIAAVERPPLRRAANLVALDVSAFATPGPHILVFRTSCSYQDPGNPGNIRFCHRYDVDDISLTTPDDPDGDGFPIGTDNCPSVANDQTNTDRDALGDACDPDDDADGLDDGPDNCELAANADEANADGDELGNACDPAPNEPGGGGGGGGTTTICNGLTATIVGTEDGETLTGTPGNDVIAALGGNDFVRASGGNEIVCGGGGRDELLGQGGTDKLLGEDGKNPVLH